MSRNYWSWLDHALMASILEKVISLLTGNLNSGLSYLITAVPHRDIHKASYGERIVYSPRQYSAGIQSYGVFQAFLATLAWYTSTGYVWLVV